MIRFSHVSKVYDNGTPAVDDLSFEAPAGKLTALVGPSGCGKTTSLRMVNRLLNPTSGTIELDGEDTATIPPVQLRRRIGYVIQHAGLFPHRTVVDNVAALPMLLGEKKAPARARAMELLERVGLDPDFAKRYPAQLSGGQQQRVGVARALATDPPFLLMDEPFSAVDPIVRTKLQDEFLRLQHELGKTILLVTHDIDEALRLADSVVVLRQGGILAQQASPAELLAHPASDFVADFLGASRGYQSLGFMSALSRLPLTNEPTARIGERVDPREFRDDWVLVVDENRAPRGWLDLRGGATRADENALNLSGTVATASGSLRALLDAALSSPARRGVVVDDQGALLGTITAAKALEQIERSQKAAEEVDGVPE